MLFAKSVFVFSIMALGNMVAASTPACLLSAVGSQKNPADLKAVCVTNVVKVQSLIEERCDDDKKEEGLSAFADICSSNGYKVSSDSTSTSSTSTGTSTSGSKSTGTGFTTATSTNSASGSSSSGSSSNSGSDSGSSSSSSSSASSSASPSDTVSAGASDRHVSAAAFAAVVFVGFAATM